MIKLRDYQQTKVCSKCKVEKPTVEFSKNRSRKDGFNHRCKICESQHEYKPNRNCEECNKSFYASPGSVEKGLGRFCSRQCSAKNRDRKIVKNCETCKKEITVHRYEVEQGLGRFCSISCEGKWRSGERSARWMGDYPINPDNAGHKRAHTLYEIQPCEICRVTPEEAVIHRHHRDENPMNNDPENITFLCAKHHRQVHRDMSKKVKK